MIKLDTFDGHIVLWAKNHYSAEDNIGILEEIKRIWSVRCGIEPEHFGQDVYEYIANRLYKILITINPDKKDHFHEIIHKGLVNSFYYGFDKDMTAIEKLIYIYRSHIMSTQVNERNEETGELIPLVDLPKPQVEIFKNITNGHFDFNHDEIIKKLDERNEENIIKFD